MKYNKVIIYKDSSEKFSKAIVETEFGKIEVTEVAKLNKLLKDFADQKGISIEELLKNKDLIEEIIIKKEAKLEENKEEKKLSDDIEDSYDDDDYFDEEEKKEKKGIVKRIIVYLTTFVVLAVGAYHLDKHTKLFNGKIANFISGKLNLDNNSNEEIIIANEDNTIVYVDNVQNSPYDTTMNGVMNRIEGTNEVVTILAVDEYNNLSSDNILQTLNDNSRLANANMFEISQFINGNTLVGDIYYYNFEANFPYGSADYNVIKIFSDLRNKIVSTAYETGDVETTKLAISDFYSLYVTVVIKGEVVSYGDVILDYNAMSDMGKATLEEMAAAASSINYKKYGYITSNGKEYTRKDIYNNAVENAEELTNKMVNKGYHK